MDLLKVNGIRAYGYTGFFAEEKKLGQWFQVDLIIETDMALAAQSDDLAEAVDYAKLVQVTQSIISSAQFDLIETLAATILERLLDTANIKSAQVRLTKETPPISDFSGSVTVQMQRQKR